MAFEFQDEDQRKECDNLKSTALVGLEKVFFDVPVYRLSKEEYESQQKDFIQKELKQCGGKYAEEAYRRYPELKSKTESDLWENYGGCWLFNEIIGFIRLYFFFSEIRGEYWHTSAKKSCALVARFSTRKEMILVLANVFRMAAQMWKYISTLECFWIASKWERNSRGGMWINLFWKILEST